MAKAPAAEIHVDVDVVRSLLEDQHPDLADRPVVPLSNGWDNVMFRLGPDLVVRIPRRRAAVDLVAHEIACLPTIAGLVTLAVPAPVRVGRPSGEVPWPWTIVPWVPGEMAALEPPSARASWAPQLARFVCDLQVPAPDDVSRSLFGRGLPLADRDDAVTRRLTTGDVPRRDELLDLWKILVPTPAHAGPPVWLHGDLHPANLLVNRGRLASVIDFGDVTKGDPATDLATAWLTFDAVGRAVFVTAVTDVIGRDDDLWRRARAWAVSLAAAIAGGSDDHPVLAAVGAHAIGELLDAPDATRL